MRLFRSEEHVARWAHARAATVGALFSPEQLWDLALRWFADRLDPAWRRRTPSEVAAIFDAVGLTGPFWTLG